MGQEAVETLFADLKRGENSVEIKSEIVREQLGKVFDPNDEDYGRPWMFGEWSEEESQRFVGPFVSFSASKYAL